MKKFTWLFLSLVLVCLLAAPATSHASIFETADFAISDSYIEVGEEFNVTVSVTHSNSSEMLTCFGFDVDPSAQLGNILFKGYLIGTGYEDWGSGNYVNGMQDLFSSDTQAPGTTLLATLYFKALSVGSDTLEVLGEFDDFNYDYGLFYQSTDIGIDGSIDIVVNGQQNGDVGAVPIPAPILLLGTGLCGLGVFRRKIKN